MVRISPVRRALVPINSEAAQCISAPNYDEFQSDREIWDMLQARPDNLLRVTMPHCHVASLGKVGADGVARGAGSRLRTDAGARGLAAHA